MAATRLIALHLNKGRTLAWCLSDRINYAENPDKTGEGVYIKSYQCDPRTAGEEFLLSKRLYTQKTGRNYGNVIAYQIRQSFKPGEVSPEQANRIKNIKNGSDLSVRNTGRVRSKRLFPLIGN